MAHYCWMCERIRSNESFSGGGHKQHLCKDCCKLPAAARLIKQASKDLWGFLRQANISRSNIKRIENILDTPDLQELFPLASVIHQIAKLKPHKRKRFGFIKWNDPELWKQMIAVGIVEFYPEEDATEDPEPFLYEEDPTEYPGPFVHEETSKQDALLPDEDDSIPF